MIERPKGELRRGWTTGACATAAAKAAYMALATGRFPDPVEITLPDGRKVGFTLTVERIGEGFAEAGVTKDAGDDPDVTHGALVSVRVAWSGAGAGVSFRAGPGVGVVTKPGLPIPPGEPAINPVPREMMRTAIAEAAGETGATQDVTLEISVADGERLALKTWNPRLGIVGGLSILGTTGVVVPYSCSAWIHSIHRGIDVARASALPHVAACTGATSERVVQRRYGLPDIAMLDMGDFAGGLLKYLRRHPVPRLTIGGGFAKIAKLAQGNLDLHSGRSQVDFATLSGWLGELGADLETIDAAGKANTAMEVLEICRRHRLPIAELVAERAAQAAAAAAEGSSATIEVVIVDRAGEIAATSAPHVA